MTTIPRSFRVVLAATSFGLMLCAGSPVLAVEPDAPEMTAADAALAPQTFAVGLDKASLESEGKAVKWTAAVRNRLSLGDEPAVHLAPVDRDKLFAEDAQAPVPGQTKVLRIGIGRDVDLRPVDGSWYALPNGGRIWSVDVVGDGALGLRLGFSQVALPRGAELAVYAPAVTDADKQYRDFGRTPEQAAEEIQFVDNARADKAAGALSWSQVIWGDRARVELYLPAQAAADASSLPFSLVQAQYLYRDPLLDGALDKAAGSCHNDVTCYPAWAQTARGVARFTFVQGGGSFLCSGQMLNTFSSDFTPYFLTANHCVNTAAAASSVNLFWLYQTATCNGNPPSLSSLKQTSNASLLSTSAASDYSFLLLNGVVPTNINLTWLGWNAGALVAGTQVACVHHPSGDFKRISFGTTANNPVCGGANHFRVNWTHGPTEPGSSGSGAFRSNTKQLVGQLHCGPSSCGSETNDSFGSFVYTYSKVSTLLATGSDDNSEPNDGCSSARTVAKGTLLSRVVKRTDTDWYKIVVPAHKKLRVTLTFTNSQGDIDLRVFKSCSGAAGGTQVASSLSTTNTEVINYTNPGNASATLSWNVFLFNDVRANYTMTTQIL
jgi:hypothetical protein